MLWMGSFSQTFMPAITTQNAVILKSIVVQPVVAAASSQEVR